MSEKKDEDKNSVVKNYLILIVLFVACFCLVLYLCNVYKVYEESKMEEPVIRGSLIEINVADLKHYVIDTPNVIVYMCAPKSQECRQFENKFKKYIQREEIVDEIIYLNLADEDYKEFTDKFNEEFMTKLKNRYPSFVVFSDGNVDSILQGDKDNNLTISKVDNFVELYRAKFENDEDDIEEELIVDISEGE